MKDVILFPYRIYVLFIFIFSTLLVFFLILLVKLFSEKTQSLLVYKITNKWAKVCMTLFFIRVEIKNKENITNENAAIFIGNHRSYIDSAVLFYAIPKNFKPLGKSEFGKIPIFGWIYKSVAIIVDRSRPYKRARSLKLLKRQLLRGVSVNLFPEGTFNMTNEPLLPFFDGAFKMALETETIIQPYLIIGTQQVLHCTSWFRLIPGTIYVKYLPPISPIEFLPNDVKAFKEKVFDEMQKALIEEGNW
jgi:1-acyl-sn-glycerol-3-phosphate acyltransferase